MSKARLEAFSDGVFAIVITLLILDIRPPDVPYAELPAVMSANAPRLIAYVMSFFLIGLYWVFHHHGLHRLERTDGVFVWLNLSLLLFVSFLPFPTALLGRYPGRQLTVVIYGLNLIAANAAGFAMVLYAHLKKEELLAPKHYGYFAETWPVYAGVNGAYVVALGASFFAPVVSMVIYGAVVVVVAIRTALYRL